jgi:hypothetical protein
MTEHKRHLLTILAAKPHHLQRYDTCGDWNYSDSKDGETLRFDVSVSEMPDWRYEALVGVHELVEALLCKHRGISDADVTAFDVAYEAKRPEGDDSEPGDDPAAPYHREHQFATQVEKLLAAELGVDWQAYEAAINAL